MSRAFAVVLVATASVLAAGSRDIQRTVPLDARGTVSIQTFKGWVEIETWNEPRAEVSARIEADTTCGPDPHQDERVRLTEIDIDSTASRLALHSNYDRIKDLPHLQYHVEGFDAVCTAYPFVRYRLRIPRTARVEIEDHKSRIALNALAADARIRTHKGTVRVKEHDGALDLETHKGDVHVEFARLAEASRLETYKGDIEVAVPRNAGFDLDARVERRGMLQAPFALDERDLGRHERAYEQKVNGGGPTLTLTTRNGSLRITER